MEIWTTLVDFFSSDRVLSILTGAVTLVVGLILARLLTRAIGRIASKRMSRQAAMITRRVSFYTLVAIVVATALIQWGFNLSILLGAAGILTVAIGFASQTSASNLISGLFLIGERPFVIGDAIKVGETIGEIVSIDLMSVKLRTFDNLFVRVPNETLLKSEITNLSYFPIRRFDLHVGVAYKEDLQRIRRILMEVADRNPQVLDEPKPVFWFLDFGDSSLNLQFSVWIARGHFFDVKTALQMEVKSAFDEEGVEIPFPHRTLYTGSVTDPFPVKLVEGRPTSGDDVEIAA